MSVLTAENLGVSFGAFDLFGGISLAIARDSKIGLIGPNGVGKTTLLLILAGMAQPSHGSMRHSRGLRIGYLPQEAMDAFADRNNTVYAEMLSVFAGLQVRQAQLHELETQMARGDASAELLERYGELQQAFDHAGGYDYELRIQHTLNGLGLGRAEWELPLAHLSGGQKTRALLARLLLEKPDLLMLDEPTNHLDLEAVEWLERTLGEWEGALLVVSHDRYFLDNSVNTIWEMSPGGIETYKGNYHAYLLQRQERWDYYQRAFEEEKARLLKEVDFIQRNWVRASSHARALGKLRQVSREIALAETYGIMALRNGMKWSESGLSADRPLDVVEAIRRVNALQPTNTRPPEMRPRLELPHHSSELAVRIYGAHIGYPGIELFTAERVELHRAECAALIGPNGSGKTTLLRTLLGQLEPLAGAARLGAGIKVGYLAQGHENLQGSHSVLDELQRHKEQPPEQARSYLARYLFRGEDVHKPLDALSGGERARLALAILTLEGANLLILDEPTNHLDIPAQEALQAVLEAYKGAILLVSHDRYLIDRLATQVWEIRERRLVTFNGSYRQYILNGAGAEKANGRIRPAGARQVLIHKPLVRGDSYDARKRLEALERLEDRIRHQETQVQQLSRRLQGNARPLPYEQASKLSWQLAQAQVELERMLHEWEGLAEA
jgi:ATP-binding cassette subfamily F protein 3